MTNWHHNLYLEVVLLDVTDMSEDMLNAPVSLSFALRICTSSILLRALQALLFS